MGLTQFSGLDELICVISLCKPMRAGAKAVEGRQYRGEQGLLRAYGSGGVETIFEVVTRYELISNTIKCHLVSY